MQRSKRSSSRKCWWNSLNLHILILLICLHTAYAVQAEQSQEVCSLAQSVKEGGRKKLFFFSTPRRELSIKNTDSQILLLFLSLPQCQLKVSHPGSASTTAMLHDGNTVIELQVVAVFVIYENAQFFKINIPVSSIRLDNLRADIHVDPQLP